MPQTNYPSNGNWTRIGLCLAFLLTIAITLAPGRAEAKFVLFGWGGEKIIQVMQLPDVPAFQNGSGDQARYIDVGYRYKQFTVFFIPLWNYDGKWCGYIGSDEQYLDFSEKELREMTIEAGLSFPEGSPIGFWDRFGGKFLVLLIPVLLMIIGNFVPDKKENEELEPEAQTPSEAS